ncbi:MAG: hypothetical protein ING02_13060 [Roseomonas sp.]|nr:hypothetical protein [Roseomonas sp.]
MMEGFWQYWITAFLCRNLDRGETAYDLEAGYGYYSLLMSELVGMQGRVVALEYNPWLYQLLNRNIILNGRNTVVVSHRILAAGQAATAQELPAWLIEPSASTQPAAPLAYGSANSCIAPAMTLDGLEQGSADLVLVSATALEHGALDGMRGLMDRSPSLRIIVQFVPGRCRTPRETLKALSDRFPLRFIDFDARAKPISIEEVIKASSVTLFLSLTDPR